MHLTYGSRDIVRNPSLLKIDGKESFVVEDKRSKKILGVYLGRDLAKEFFDFRKKQQLLESAKKIKNSSKTENTELDGTISDGL